MISSAAAGDLLRWYDRVQRLLPWRRSRDPYRVWVSEVMLQQTQVARVRPYYERFVAHFPTVESLAAASEEEVLGLWSGLGYYRRARSLHRAARKVAAAGGELPPDPDDLRQLPGIGDYTAAAVASIAFGVPVPVFDGNVARVTARLVAEDGDPRRAPVRRRLLEVARGLLDVARPGDSNQAMMELGALVCTPRAPACESCPLEATCAARAQDDPEAYPATSEAGGETVRIRGTVLVVTRDGRVLVVRRPDDAQILAGTWELPWHPGTGSATAAALGARYGGRWRRGDREGRIRHSVTFRRFELAVHRGELRGEAEDLRRPARWVEPALLGEVPSSSLVEKGVEAAGLRSPRSPRR